DNCSAPTLTQSDGPQTTVGCVTTQTRTWTAVDACGNSSTASRTVSWSNDTQAPTITAAANATIECTASPSFTAPTASDACSTVTVVQVGTDVTSGTSCAKTTTRTWRAVDACGNSSSTVTQIITQIDSQAPIIGAAGANTTIECT